MKIRFLAVTMLVLTSAAAMFYSRVCNVLSDGTASDSVTPKTPKANELQVCAPRIAYCCLKAAHRGSDVQLAHQPGCIGFSLMIVSGCAGVLCSLRVAHYDVKPLPSVGMIFSQRCVGETGIHPIYALECRLWGVTQDFPLLHCLHPEILKPMP